MGGGERDREMGRRGREASCCHHYCDCGLNVGLDRLISPCAQSFSSRGANMMSLTRFQPGDNGAS